MVTRALAYGFLAWTVGGAVACGQEAKGGAKEWEMVFATRNVLQGNLVASREEAGGKAGDRVVLEIAPGVKLPVEWAKVRLLRRVSGGASIVARGGGKMIWMRMRGGDVLRGEMCGMAGNEVKVKIGGKDVRVRRDRIEEMRIGGGELAGWSELTGAGAGLKPLLHDGTLGRRGVGIGVEKMAGMLWVLPDPAKSYRMEADMRLAYRKQAGFQPGKLDFYEHQGEFGMELLGQLPFSSIFCETLLAWTDLNYWGDYSKGWVASDPEDLVEGKLNPRWCFRADGGGFVDIAGGCVKKEGAGDEPVDVSEYGLSRKRHGSDHTEYMMRFAVEYYPASEEVAMYHWRDETAKHKAGWQLADRRKVQPGLPIFLVYLQNRAILENVRYYEQAGGAVDFRRQNLAGDNGAREKAGKDIVHLKDGKTRFAGRIEWQGGEQCRVKTGYGVMKIDLGKVDRMEFAGENEGGNASAGHAGVRVTTSGGLDVRGICGTGGQEWMTAGGEGGGAVRLKTEWLVGGGEFEIPLGEVRTMEHEMIYGGSKQ